MIAHGVSTPMLFFLLGMLYERRHSYEIEDFGGLAASIPSSRPCWCSPRWPPSGCRAPAASSPSSWC
jgi:hypothetical protein